MIQNAIMKPYNTSKIIVLPIEENMECQIDRDRRELDSLSTRNKYKHPSCVIWTHTILMSLQNDASKCNRIV